MSRPGTKQKRINKKASRSNNNNHNNMTDKEKHTALQDLIEGKNERTPVPSTYSRRKKQEKELYYTRRMMNNMRRKETLARAAIPRSHRHFRHVDDANTLEVMATRVKAFVPVPHCPFQRPAPGAHSKKYIAEKEEQLLVWKAQLSANDEEDKELKGKIEAEENALQIFRHNFYHFEAVYVFAIHETQNFDKEESTKLKKQDKEEQELKRVQQENKSMQKEDKLQYREKEKEKSKKRTASPRYAHIRPQAITNFFRPVDGHLLRKTKRFYHTFYHDRIVGAQQHITTPSFRDTQLYAGICGTDNPLTKENKRKKTVHNEKIGLFKCKQCGGTDFEIDRRTTESMCTKCGVVIQGPQKYVQSFAEAQASSIRTTAPYERVSHVSKTFLGVFYRF
jgi:ribosomal protein L37AE/L43A